MNVSGGRVIAAAMLAIWIRGGGRIGAGRGGSEGGGVVRLANCAAWRRVDRTANHAQVSLENANGRK